MILTRTPLRISFVGGGSDRPRFFAEEPGACVAAAIDKYVYVAVNPKYDGTIRAAYSVTENVTTIDDLRHDLIREALKAAAMAHGIEIHSIADVPGGTGLGSSSAFMVGLLHALRPGATPESYAGHACEIEIHRCRKPIGKQDQYTAAYGGLNLLRFSADGVTVDRVACDLDALSAHCLLLDTGTVRSGDAGAVLAAQQQDRDEVRELARLARVFATTLADDDLVGCGVLLHAAWQIKQRFVGAAYDQLYQRAVHAGAWGGKLCGAGGGGFLLFLAPPARHQAIARALELRRVPVAVGVPGSEVVWPAH